MIETNPANTVQTYPENGKNVSVVPQKEEKTKFFFQLSTYLQIQNHSSLDMKKK